MKRDRTPHPDQRFIEALSRNDHLLIKQLYDKCVPMVVQLIKKNSGSQQDARDIFQEAMIGILRKAESLKLYVPIEAYVYRVCRNLWLNELKKRGRGGVTFTDLEQYNEEGMGHFDMGETDFERQKWQLFNKMLGELSERCREFLRLSWAGHAMDEVAKTLGVSYGFARKKKSECQGRLVKLVQASAEYKQLRLSI